MVYLIEKIMATFTLFMLCIVILPCTSICKPLPSKEEKPLPDQDKINREVALFNDILNQMENPPPSISPSFFTNLAIALKAKLQMLAGQAVKVDSLQGEKKRSDLYRVLLGIGHRVDTLEEMLSAGSDIKLTGPRDIRWKKILQLKTPIVKEFLRRIINAGLEVDLFAKTIQKVCQERNDRAGHGDISLPEELDDGLVEDILARMKIRKDENTVRTIQLLISPLTLPSTSQPAN